MKPDSCRKPGIDLRARARAGHGTLVMTLRRNQSVPRFSASVLTTVGIDARVDRAAHERQR